MVVYLYYQCVNINALMTLKCRKFLLWVSEGQIRVSRNNHPMASGVSWRNVLVVVVSLKKNCPLPVSWKTFDMILIEKFIYIFWFIHFTLTWCGLENKMVNTFWKLFHCTVKKNTLITHIKNLIFVLHWEYTIICICEIILKKSLKKTIYVLSSIPG